MLKVTHSHQKVQTQDSSLTAEVLLDQAALERNTKRGGIDETRKKQKGNQNTGHATEQ